MARATRTLCTVESEIGTFIEEFRRRVVDRFFDDDEDRDRVDQCLLEVLNNAQEHGNRFEPQRTICVEWEVDENYLRLSVEDEGAGFEWPAAFKKPRPGQQRGMGLYLINLLSEELSCLNGGRRIVLLFKR